MRFIPGRLALVLAAVFALTLSLYAIPADAQAVRKSITELTPAEVMSLRRGVARMMSFNTADRTSADFRRSWIYWANIHGHFGEDCRGPVVGNGMEGVELWTASNPSEDATWCTCEHNSNQFLTWHRMFLYYFERVLRQSANDPTLTLPYWDEATDRRLPQPFRNQTYVDETGATVPNPLYIAARRPTLNSGAARLAVATASSANAMRATRRRDFERRIESTPHGSVHCAIANGGCPNGIMGAVGVAALDPIFYLHHANIDRLYECWLEVNEAGRLPTSQSILNRRYSFIDGDGSVRQRQVRDMLTLAQLDYSYAEGGAGCPPPVAPPPAPVVAASPEAVTLAAQEEQATLTAEAQAAPMAAMNMKAPTELKRGTTVVPVEVDKAAAPLAPYARSGTAGAPAKSALVTIAGVNAAVVPGVLYNVYLANDAGKREQIGVISFFSFGGPPAGKHAHGDSTGRDFEFDATTAVRKLGLTTSKAPKLIFEPTTGLTDSTPKRAAKSIPVNAKVTFRSAKLTIE